MVFEMCFAGTVTLDAGRQITNQLAISVITTHVGGTIWRWTYDNTTVWRCFINGVVVATSNRGVLYAPQTQFCFFMGTTGRAISRLI